MVKHQAGGPRFEFQSGSEFFSWNKIENTVSQVYVDFNCTRNRLFNHVIDIGLDKISPTRVNEMKFTVHMPERSEWRDYIRTGIYLNSLIHTNK